MRAMPCRAIPITECIITPKPGGAHCLPIRDRSGILTKLFLELISRCKIPPHPIPERSIMAIIASRALLVTPMAPLPTGRQISPLSDSAISLR